MTEIIALTACLTPLLSRTSLRHLQVIVLALLSMNGRVTMLGLARWTEAGGSYRTLQRWFSSGLDWGSLMWTVVRVHVADPEGAYVLAGDEVVVSKAGKQTHGLGRFYSSIAQRPLPGLSFFALSLVDVRQRRAYPLSVQQRLPVTAAQRVTSAAKRGRGRPKGSKNHAKADPVLSPELRLLETLLRTLLKRIGALRAKHLVLDGFFGTYPPTWLTRACGLHLISKLRHNAALDLPYTGSKPRRGPTPRCGDKLDYTTLPYTACVSAVTEGKLLIETYQLMGKRFRFVVKG